MQVKIEELKTNPGIIRNKLKIKASINNSRIFRDIVAEYGSFHAYLKVFTKDEIIYETDKTTNVSGRLIRPAVAAVGFL